MSRRHQRIWLLPLLFLAGQAWALGLGDIRLSSALNQPLRAEIELLAATPEELNNLTVQLAAAETFARYDLERPLFLTRLQFQVVKSGTANGNFVRVTSPDPVTEPFITVLVEAIWSRGRLLREYTLLLDPPTFAPPPVTDSTQTVIAPSRANQADSGQIQRPAPQPAEQQPAPRPVQAPVQTQAEAPAETARPAPQPAQSSAPQSDDSEAEELDRSDFDATPAGELLVVRGDTLWGITNRVRPDSRLTINQTMLAIFEANPQAFEGNINRLRAGATLRIPSADEIFTINRGNAFAEVERQNEEWGGTAGLASGATTPEIAPETPATEPNLTLVPPDEEDLALTDTSVEPALDDPIDEAVDDVFVDPTEQRINEIQALLEDQDALIEIPDNELAALRAELAELRGEPIPEPELTADEIDELEDDLLAEEAEAAAADDVVETAETDAPPVVSRPPQQEGIVDVILGYLTNFWVIIGAALLIAVLVLVWFMRRASGGDDEDRTGMWNTLEEDELEGESLASTESMRAFSPDETTILVEEQGQPDPSDFKVDDAEPLPDALDQTGATEVPAAVADIAATPPAADPLAETGTNAALEDTFSSDTAINLDQSDPVAEADFHMAYGLYDQAADLINGALASEPEREDLLAKLCEIYFVWGNRDAFVDAAGRLRSVIGSDSNAEWDKIVIMGQQIAGDHEMFSGVSAGAATKAVDLSFEGSDENTGALDMDFASDPEGDGDEVIDLGAETGQVAISPDRGDDIDFSFEEPDPLAASATREMSDPDDDSATSEIVDDNAGSDRTVETPTIEQQFEVLEATGELPALKDQPDTTPAADATAEIDLDDLGLDLDSLADVSLADDVDDLDDTAQGKGLDIDDDPDATGSIPMEDDLEATGQNPDIAEAGPDLDRTGIQEGIDISKAMAADDETMLASDNDDHDATDGDISESLLDATGMTQVISKDMGVDTEADAGATLSDDEKTMLAPSLRADHAPPDDLPDDAETLLASLDDDDDDGDFDFAKTEALPKDVFSPDSGNDETGNMPGPAGNTDMDLDLDDLTAALKVSEVGDTVNQPREDATVEHPRMDTSDVDLDVGNTIDEEETSSTTQALAPGELTDDLHDARTMTEVGTKLDLARAYVDMGDPGGARSILEEVLDEGDAGQKQQAQQLLDSLPA